MITKEAVEAAREAYAKYGQSGDLRTTPMSFGCAEAMLTAAYAALPAGVGVEEAAHKALKAWEAWEAKLILEGSDQLWCELGDLSELQALRNAALKGGEQ